jgi:hypothetical protein
VPYREETAFRRDDMPATKKTTTKNSPKATATKRSTRAATKSSTLSTAQKDRLPDSAFAFTAERKEPLTDAKHVRNAIARFLQVEDVSDAERDRAWRRIRAAARKFGVEISERGWRELSGKSKSRKH